jgi:hypothetical protein
VTATDDLVTVSWASDGTDCWFEMDGIGPWVEVPAEFPGEEPQQ